MNLQGETWEPQRNKPSSYPDYLRLRNTTWVHPEYILAYFSENNPRLSYEAFVTEQEDPYILSNITLE